MSKVVISFALAFGLGACGGSTEGSGTGGSGGTAKLESQAAVTLHIQAAKLPETPPGKTCAVHAHDAVIGGPPSSESKGEPVTDGQDAHVECSVTGAGTFGFSASVTWDSTSFAITDGSITKGGSGTAVIEVCDATTGFCLTSPAGPDAYGFGAPCAVFVDQVSLDVTAGRIWARIECPALENASKSDVWCAADSGVFVLENCDQG